MPKKINAYEGFKMPSRRSETRTFTDPARPGQELVLSLHSLFTPEIGRAADDAKELRTYYWGDAAAKIKRQKPFPLIDGKAFELGSSFCFYVQLAVMMQDTVREGQKLGIDELYDFEQMAGVAIVMPTAWGEVIEWVQDLNREADLGNLLEDGTATGS